MVIFPATPAFRAQRADETRQSASEKQLRFTHLSNSPGGLMQEPALINQTTAAKNMNKPIAKMCTFASVSNPEIEYEPLHHVDGTTS